MKKPLHFVPWIFTKECKQYHQYRADTNHILRALNLNEFFTLPPQLGANIKRAWEVMHKFDMQIGTTKVTDLDGIECRNAHGLARVVE